MPDRFLQAAPLAAMIEQRAADARRRGADDLERPAGTTWTPTRRDISSLREVDRRRLGLPARADARLRRSGTASGVIHAWGMTETSPLGSVARPPAGAEGEEAWRYRYTQGRVPAGGGRPGSSAPAASVLPADGTSVGELEVRGPWITGALPRRGRRPDDGEVPRRLAAHR